MSGEPGGHTSYIITSDKGAGTCFARVRLSVYLLARLLKNVCTDLHEMLRVDRCRDMDNYLTFQPDPQYSPDAGTALLSPISCISAATRNFSTSGKSHVYVSAASRCNDACF